MRLIASRNLRICTKDCMCLYVCPTGATDTETGQIDFDKCTGCGDCARSCPNAAISMIPLEYPVQQPKDERVADALRTFTRSKAAQESIAKSILASCDDADLKTLMTAVSRADRLVGEDLVRESGYMLPQSGNVRRLLESFLEDPPEGFPTDAAERLLDLLRFNE